MRVLAGYALFILTEYSVWIAMLVFAYAHGGATIAALVAVAQLVPAAVLAPVAATAADRRSPAVLLAGGYLIQAAAMAATAVAVFAGAVIAAYAAAVLAAAAVTITRPAQSALMPAVSATPDQLTAANVVVGWVEAAGITLAGLLAGALIWLGGVGSVFAASAALGVAAALLVARLGERTPARPRRSVARPCSPTSATACGWRPARPRLRLMLALLTAEAVVDGALDLLFVILAVGVLGRSQAWAGDLNSAFGVGGVLAATVSAALVGRRLGGPILAAALVLSAALAALAATRRHADRIADTRLAAGLRPPAAPHRTATATARQRSHDRGKAPATRHGRRAASPRSSPGLRSARRAGPSSARYAGVRP